MPNKSTQLTQIDRSELFKIADCRAEIKNLESKKKFWIISSDYFSIRNIRKRIAKLDIEHFEARHEYVAKQIKVQPLKKFPYHFENFLYLLFQEGALIESHFPAGFEYIIKSREEDEEWF